MPYDVGSDPYLDKRTGVLRNKIGIHDAAALEKAEAEISYSQISTLILENKAELESFNWQLICDLHQYIFGDIYSWAGQSRPVEISKGTTSFARAAHIVASADQLFAELKAENYLRNLAEAAFVKRLAHYYAELNVLHPFREGNGRVIRTLLYMLAEKVGYALHWDKMNAQENIDASIAAYNGDEAPLATMLTRITTVI